MSTEFSYSGTELEAFIEARNYYRAMLKFFRPHLGARVVEVGAGIGNFSTFLLEIESLHELTALEPSANLYPLLCRRFADNHRVWCLKHYLHEFRPADEIDSIVSVNVLEHIENDGGFLRSALNLLAPGGTILLFTPALPALYGTLDRQFHHHRRYTKAGLGEQLRASGFSVELLRYFDLPGVLGWLLATRVLKRNTIHPSDVRRYDRFVFSWSSKLEHWWSPPVGKNLLAIGRKPKRDA